MFKKLVAVAALSFAIFEWPAVSLADGEWCENEPGIQQGATAHSVVYRVFDPVASHLHSTTWFVAEDAALLSESGGQFQDTQVLIVGGSADSVQGVAVVYDNAGLRVRVEIYDNGNLVATGATNQRIDYTLHS